LVPSGFLTCKVVLSRHKTSISGFRIKRINAP
jgi:hypothetical protein